MSPDPAAAAETPAPTTPKPKAGCRTWALRIAMMLMAPLLVLLVIEVVWQIVGDPRYARYEEFLAKKPPHFRLAQMGLMQPDDDPELAYSIVPGFDETVGGNRYRIAPGGFRGAAVPEQKPAGERRVLVLGDSYAFGFGVAENGTIGAQLEPLLQSADKKIRVLTLGVPGYQTGQELAVLQRDGLRYAPDVVALVYYANDNFEHASEFDPRIKTFYNDVLPLPRGVKRTLIRSILYAKVTESYTRILQGKGILDSRGPHNFPVTSGRIRAMAELCRSKNIGFVLVAIPALDNSIDFLKKDHIYNQDHDRLLGFAKEITVPVVDVREILLRRAPRPIEELFVVPPDPKDKSKASDSHLIAAGYGLIAKDLARLITEQKLLR